MFRKPTLINYLLVIIIAIFCTNCDEEPNRENFDFQHYFPLSIDQKEFFVQIAIDPKEHRQGLMFRNSLDENHGMLFAFSYPKQVAFWMKNVPIPLDIGYFDSNGRLIEIHSLYPNDETQIVSKSHSIQYTLEMNKGWYHENKISTGKYIDLENALKYIQLRKTSLNLKD